MRKTLYYEQIANALVENAINDGFLISVTGKRGVVDRSRNFAEITKAMFSTDMDTLTLNVEERRVGIITLIYGNGSDGQGMISDHTDVPHINRLVEHTLKKLIRAPRMGRMHSLSISGVGKDPYSDLPQTANPSNDGYHARSARA